VQILVLQNIQLINMNKIRKVKKVCKVAIVAFTILIIGYPVKAQVKTGYINLNELVGMMPETKTVQTQVDVYQKQFSEQLTSMNNEFQSKGQVLDAQKSTMTDAIRTAKETELNDLQKRISDYTSTARQQVTDKFNELLKPVVDKALATITEVAKEKGYAIVLDSYSTNLLGNSVLVAPPADILMDAVKAKLGIVK
jgi:outer membrane protein